MLYQRVMKDQVDAYEYTDPMSEELIEALEAREGMYVFKTGETTSLVIHTLFKDKKASLGDYIVFFADGTIDVQDKDTFFSKFESIDKD